MLAASVHPKGGLFTKDDDEEDMVDASQLDTIYSLLQLYSLALCSA
jgi:hypothetical protein